MTRPYAHVLLIVTTAGSNHSILHTCIHVPREEKVWLQFHTICCKYHLSPFCSVLRPGEQNLSAWSKKYVEVDGFVKKWPLVGSSGEKTRPCDIGY